MQTKKPLVVLLFLLVASLACYSDSPLWVFGVTEVPPTSTFLPEPDTNYPAKYSPDQLVLAPEPAEREQPFFFVTRLPGELLSGVRNASGSCEYGDTLEILYIGHIFDETTDQIYLDEMSLVPAEGDSEVLYNFDDGNTADWAILESEAVTGSVGLESLEGINYSDAASIRYQLNPLWSFLDEDAVDVSNASGVLSLDTDIRGSTRLAGAYARFDTSNDWSAYQSLSMRVFVPAQAVGYRIDVYLKTGTGEEAVSTERMALTSGEWTTITVDLSSMGDLSDVRELGLRVGPSPTRTYYLVTCAGTVGWVNENRIAGPVAIARGQSAQTLNVGIRPGPATGGFQLHEGAEPPTNAATPPSSRTCEVGEVVDVTDISAVEDVTGQFKIWYQIFCPTSGVQGWVAEDRLFGPLVLPATEGQGIISSDVGVVQLTANPGDPVDENSPVCEANTLFETQAFANVETENGYVPYYQVSCGDNTGWVRQSTDDGQLILLELTHLPDNLVVAIGEQSLQDAVEGEDEDGTEDSEDSIISDYAPVPLTNEPAIALEAVEGSDVESNIVGRCPSGTVVPINEVQPRNEVIFYHVTCVLEYDETGAVVNEVEGWVEDRFLPNATAFGPGRIGWFTQESPPKITGTRETYEGRVLFGEPQLAGDNPRVGQCDLFQPITVDAVALREKALYVVGSKFRLFYQITCLDPDGVEITGWVNADEVGSDLILIGRDPYQLLGG